MKSISFTFIIAMFAVSCAAAWTPSAEEIALSAREDAREAALFLLIGK